ncbi:MAG TPA: TRAP transporter large permease subunit, partial [Clostridia bacterium]|nr:TRAP transporter large permease subunit [Clostridia bacterium]
KTTSALTEDFSGGATGLVKFLEKVTLVMDRLLFPINHKLNVLSYTIVGIMSLPIVCDVLARILTKKSLPGVIEIEEFMLIAVVFLGLAQVEANKENIRIELLFSRLPKWMQHVLDSFIYLSTMFLFATVSWQTVLQMSKKIGITSTALGIPISIFIGVAALGLALLTLTLVRNFLHIAMDLLRCGKRPYLLIIIAICIGIFMLPFYVKALTLKMAGLTLGALGVLLLFVLMLFGMPIGFAMALVGYLGLLLARRNPTAAFGMMGIAPYYSTASYILAVVPLFILMGELALYSGISNDVFDTAYKWLGRLPGGLAMSAVAGCAGFAAVCGDSMATAVTMGTVALPEMKKKNYHPSLATGCLAAGGTLGILIPPSVGFIFYAIITEESVGKLFVAGIVPGILLALLFMGTIYLYARRNPEKVPRGGSIYFERKDPVFKGYYRNAGLICPYFRGNSGRVFQSH